MKSLAQCLCVCVVYCCGGSVPPSHPTDWVSLVVCVHGQAGTGHYNGAADVPLEPYSGEAAALPPPPPQPDDYYDALPASASDRQSHEHEQEQYCGKRRRGLWVATVGWVVDGLMGTAGRLWTAADKCSPCDTTTASTFTSTAAATAPAAQHYEPTLYTRAPRLG